jgi:hypothetical protein
MESAESTSLILRASHYPERHTLATATVSLSRSTLVTQIMIVAPNTIPMSELLETAFQPRRLLGTNIDCCCATEIISISPPSGAFFPH